MKLKDFRHKIDNIPLEFDDFEVVVFGIKYNVVPNSIKCNYNDKEVIIQKVL